MGESNASVESRYGGQAAKLNPHSELANVPQPAEISVASVIEQEQQVHAMKQHKIALLLKERVMLAESTKARLAGIAAELKSLGWHRTKTARPLTTQANANAK